MLGALMGYVRNRTTPSCNSDAATLQPDVTVELAWEGI